MPAPRLPAALRWMAIGGAWLCAAACGLANLQRPPVQAAAAQAPADDGGLKAYLETMNGLGGTDPAHQADVFYEVERDFTRAPTTANTLRYAVALVTAGHPAAKPTDGKKMLETLLATPERMVPSERILAEVLLHEINARLKLEAENRRLLATLDDRGKSQANSDKRVQAQVEENARLRRALAEAQQKLDAIKEIERSIIERSPTSPGNRDTAPSETKSPPPGR